MLQLNQSVIRELRTATGFADDRVILANQSFGIPEKPFSTMYIVNTNYIDQPGSYWVDNNDDTFSRFIDQIKETTIRIQVFGDINSGQTFPIELVQSIYFHFMKESTVERMFLDGIVMVDVVAGPEDVTQITSGSDYEPIAFIDLLFREKQQFSEILEPVETVSYNGTIDDTIIINDTVGPI